MGERIPLENQVGADVVLDPVLPSGSQQTRMAALYGTLAARVAETPRPTVVAGDCVAAIGVLGGLQRSGTRASILFFDAHGDFHTWDTTQSEFIGGMPLAMLTGRGEQTIVDGAGLIALDDDRAWLIDGRDLDPGEDAAVARSGVRHMSVAAVAEGQLPAGPIHLHVDLDVVDPADMPAMNYPAPDGPDLAEVAAAVEAVVASNRLVAASFSTWNPELDGATHAAVAAEQLFSLVAAD